MGVEAGFLIVKSFSRLYRDYALRYDLRGRDVYAAPRIDKTPVDYAIQYRGLDRDALIPVACEVALWRTEVGRSASPAELRLGKMEESGRCVDDFLFRLDDAEEVHQLLDGEKEDYEIIWARIASADQAAPAGFFSTGYEPSYFQGDHFSASCDCMLIPRWHGTDPEGRLFFGHFRRLNRHGLFQTVREAEEFLEYYLSFDWTEQGTYVTAEVFIRDPAGEALGR